jgi:hypothetical protein
LGESWGQLIAVVPRRPNSAPGNQPRLQLPSSARATNGLILERTARKVESGEPAWGEAPPNLQRLRGAAGAAPKGK